MYDASFQRELVKRKSFLAQDKGIVAMSGPMALDAQQQLSGTVANSGVPAFLSTFVDRDILRILYTPMKMATILGDERKVGDWVTKTAMFPVVERTGDVSAYDDYSNNGAAGANFDFPQRQSYTYQTIIDYGEREVDFASLAGINLVAEKKEGATIALNKFQNRSYAYGINGLQNYGLLNDPSLPASIQPGPKAYNSQAHGPWITNGVFTATPNEVYADIQALFYQLQIQAGGLIELDQRVPLVLAMPVAVQTAVTSANSFGVTAERLIKDNFPNITFETAVEYSGAAGNLVQLIAKTVEGQKTGWPAFTEKLRTHRLVTRLSSWAMKISQGTWGNVLRQPWAVSSMLGV